MSFSTTWSDTGIPTRWNRNSQRWRGVRIGRLLDDAGLAPAGAHVRVVSVTGYRWSFALADARDLLLATHIGDAPLTHGHGAPCRLVAPGRRGFQWVKWVERIEVVDSPWWLQPPFPLQ